MLEKTEGTIKNGQFRDIHRKHWAQSTERRKNKQETPHRKLKE
jgi:hypothetical protein